MPLSRRRLLEVALAAPVPLVLATWSGRAGATPFLQGAPLAPTPTCRDEDEPTPEQTEGPFFTPRSPRRRSLIEPGTTGTRLLLTGVVVTTGCKPLARALLEFWQADARGVYDNAGYHLRGHQLTDARGRFRLETVVPGAYRGRTRHIHVKVQAPGQPVLTTQLYFPGEPRNRADGIFDPELLVRLSKSPRRWTAGFDFVLDVR